MVFDVLLPMRADYGLMGDNGAERWAEVNDQHITHTHVSGCDIIYRSSTETEYVFDAHSLEPVSHITKAGVTSSLCAPWGIGPVHIFSQQRGKF